MTPAGLCLTAACLICSAAAAEAARRRLRCWFYSALEYTQARLLEKSVRFPFSFPLSPALFLRGYFGEDRARLVWTLWGGCLTPALSLAAALAAGLTALPYAAAGLLILQLIPFAIQLASRAPGTDGKRHERFNRYAPLSAADRQAAARQMKKTVLSALGRRFFPSGAKDLPAGANTLRDERLTSYLARF